MQKNDNLNTYQRIRKEVAKKRRDQLITDFEFVIKETSNFFNESEEDILSKSRKVKFALPRLFCYFILRCLDHPYAGIGDLFKRDHATILYGVRRINNLEEMVEKGFCTQDDRNIIEKAREIACTVWIDNHEGK